MTPKKYNHSLSLGVMAEKGYSTDAPDFQNGIFAIKCSLVEVWRLSPVLLMLYSHIINMHICTYTCRMHIDAMNKDERRLLLEKYTSHFIWKVARERELEKATELQYIDPHSYGHQCFFPVLLMLLNQRPGGPTPLGAGFLYHILWPTGLVSKLVSKLTDFLSSPSYITVPSPSQSLEWHVWSSSSGNSCHEVYRSLSSGASVYDGTAGFYFIPYCQPSPPTPMEYALPPSLEWNVWPGRRSIYNTDSFCVF